MSAAVQVTLIICVTIIILYILSCLKIEYKSDEGSNHLPNYPAPSNPTKPPSIGSSVQKE